jgi:hypothetical protein
MGFVFQSCDRGLASALGVQTMVYGDELFDDKPREQPADAGTALYAIKSAGKTIAAPLVAGMIESGVSNRAEVQRFYGINKFTKIEQKLAWNPIGKACGPAFVANSSRNFIMSSTSFVITPTLFNMLPAEQKTQSNLFWFGLGVNIFGGNVIAITQQALWGRVLDYGAEGGGQKINYKEVIKSSLKKEGYSGKHRAANTFPVIACLNNFSYPTLRAAAFFTLEKWFARVLMNAPAQGSS